jgi:hypothetical protein
MIENMNVRTLTNNFIFVQYMRDRKAEDAAFPTWKEFILWLTEQQGYKENDSLFRC